MSLFSLHENSTWLALMSAHIIEEETEVPRAGPAPFGLPSAALIISSPAVLAFEILSHGDTMTLAALHVHFGALR